MCMSGIEITRHGSRDNYRLAWPIKFILVVFVSYLGERGVMCVGNGSHFCTPVLINMCNVTFQVLRLSTFVFNKCSEKNIHNYICG